MTVSVSFFIILRKMRALKDEKVVDIRKVYKNGVTDLLINIVVKSGMSVEWFRCFKTSFQFSAGRHY